MSDKTISQANKRALNIPKIISDTMPHLMLRLPVFLQKIYFRLLSYILREKEINSFLLEHQDKQGLDFLNEFFEYLDFSYTMSARDKEKIPAQGKLLIIANHPLGMLDGMVLLKAVKEVRSDVKIVTEDMLWKIENLQSILLPFDSVLEDNNPESNYSDILKSLQNEEAVIVFPASEVSKMYFKGIQTGKWRKQVFSLAQKSEAPILPIFVKAKNSSFFYFVSFFSRKFATLLIPRETFNKKHKTISLKVGDPVPYPAYKSLKVIVVLKLLKKQLKSVVHNGKGPFKTEKNVIHPVDRKELRAEIMQGNLLGKTDDDKMIFFLSYEEYPITMREISRLRELTFRKMGEGTGKKRDVDQYDIYYRHLVLWDDKELEIVGSYRFGIGKEILAQKGLSGFYVDSLFQLQPKFKEYLDQTVELGRSFVQQKYWNSQALDYLWHGIGAFLVQYPEVKYLVGPVTISPSYSKDAKEMLVYFYRKWFPGPQGLTKAKNPYKVPPQISAQLEDLFTSSTYKEDFKILKANLKHFGFSVPTLYKQYTELCDQGGVGFIDFGVDESFGNCIDGFIMVQVEKIVERKKARYIFSKMRQPETAIMDAQEN